jgi:hypothetical protein
MGHANAAPGDEGPLDTGPLGPLDHNPRVDLASGLARLEQLWGVDTDTDSFPCPIPGHTSTARIGTPPDEHEMRLLCNCKGRWRSLGEVRAGIAYGSDRHLRNIEIATWTRLLAFEIGCFAPVAVPFPTLPEHASPHACHVRERLAVKSRDVV